MTPKPKGRVLAIDDQLDLRDFVEGLLRDAGHEVCTASTAAEATARIEADGPFDVVVLDAGACEGETGDFLARLRQRWPTQAVIVVSGFPDVRSAVAAMRQGAFDYLLKPIQRKALLEVVAGGVEGRESRAQQTGLVDENLALMSRVSLFEHALGLLGLDDVDQIGACALQLLCAEVRAVSGLLWLPTEEGRFRLSCVHGELDDGTAPGGPAFDKGFGSDLAKGQPFFQQTSSGARGNGQLYVPCLRGGQLLGIVCLRPPDPDSVSDAALASCGNLAQITATALAAARELPGQESLRDAVTQLPTRAFLDEVTQVEVRKAHRYGRRLCLVCAELEVDVRRAAQVAPRIVPALRGTLRGTDILVSESGRRFWVLVTDTDPLGGVVLKRRLGQRIREALLQGGLHVPLALGAASYPTDGELPQQLFDVALGRVRDERGTLAADLGIDSSTPLAEISERLLADAVWMPGDFIREAACLLIGELTCRPWDRGLLFLSPGSDRPAVMEPLTVLGDAETATDVFVTTDGETIPSGASLTALSLPPGVAPETTWMLRLGEAPPYALVGGAPRRDGCRPVYHSSDPVLIEHIAFRLRAEIGFGVRA